VTIQGTNFRGTVGQVFFNGTPASITSWGANNTVIVTVPSGATTGNVVLETYNAVLSNGVAFTATGSAPNINGLSPGSGVVGTPVTIAGTNFGAMQCGSTVTFNGTAATPTNWSATS